jgi:hypothetical protein
MSDRKTHWKVLEFVAKAAVPIIAIGAFVYWLAQ